ncbi:hypothetical protein ACSBPH_04620 [Microbacterium sp. F51-2R]|uniref:hypothetical protein n=1 Tax=Microbacterium sp. F51-2R TaxID=3445777 RepID=UPI003F9F0219
MDLRVIVVDVTATSTRVIVASHGVAVADREICWATRAVVTDAAPVMIAKARRSQYAAAKRDREQAAQVMPAQRTMFRDTSDYDVLFSVDFDPTTGGSVLTAAIRWVWEQLATTVRAGGLVARGVSDRGAATPGRRRGSVRHQPADLAEQVPRSVRRQRCAAFTR